MGKASRKKNKGEASPPLAKGDSAGFAEGRLSATARGITINWIHVAIIIVVGFAVYCNTLSMGYVWDDIPQIQGRGIIHSLWNIPKFFSNEVWVGTGGSHGSPYYRPLFNVSLALDYFFWKDNLAGYHLTNILLHILAVLALYLVALQLFKSEIAAFASALLFAVHPVHSDAVAWVSARNEPFCAALMFFSLYAYLRFRESGGRRNLIISLALFSLSLLVKETAVTLPLILAAYELCLGTGPIKKRLFWPGIFCLVTIPYFLARMAVLGSTLTMHFDPFPTRLFTSFVLNGIYLKLLTLPVHLSLFYDIPVQENFFAWNVLGSFVILVVIAALVGIYVRKYKLPLFCILWVFITLLPVAGLVSILKPAPMADRYLYIPSAGFAMAAVWAFSLLLDRLATAKGNHLLKRRSFAIGAGALLLIILFVMNFQRNYAWSDDLHFSEQRAKDAPHNEVVRNELGIAYLNKQMYDKAKTTFEETLVIKPNFAEAFFNLGLLNQQKGEIGIAWQYFNNAILVKPGFPDPKVSLGLLLLSQKQYREAEVYLKEALSLKPKEPNAMYGIGLVYLSLGKNAEGEHYLLQLLDIDPEYTDAHNALGVYYLKSGNIEKALAHLENACRLRPDRMDFRQNLEVARQMQKKS